MTASIYGIRLRETEGTTTLPFLHFYLVPEPRVPEIYALFGLSFSVGITNEHRAWLQNYKPWARVRDGEEQMSLSLPPLWGRVVVPLRRSTPRGERVRTFFHRRVFNKERQTSHLKALARGLPPHDTVIHTGPEEKDVVSMCALCDRSFAHALGDCTPGLSTCAVNLRVPNDSLVRIKTR